MFGIVLYNNHPLYEENIRFLGLTKEIVEEHMKDTKRKVRGFFTFEFSLL